MSNVEIHRRDQMILTTIEIINELGIQGLSTREIAKRQGISEAALFRHFRSKNELLLAVLDNYSQFDEDIFQSVIQKKMMPKEALLYLVTVYAEYFDSYPAVTSITHIFDILRSDPEFKEKVIEILNMRNDFTRQLFLDAQQAGEITPDADCELLSCMLWGTCREISLRWRINMHSFSMKERSVAAAKMLLDAYSPKSKIAEGSESS